VLWRSGGVRPVQGDGDAPVLEADRASEVQEVSGDGPVLVVVAQVGVEVSGEVQFRVVGEQTTHHLQCPCRQAGLGPHSGGVELVGGELGRDALEPVARLVQVVSCDGHVVSQHSDRREVLVKVTTATVGLSPECPF
jgi:hypothetical protein